MIEVVEKIDKRSYCDNKAEYIWFRQFLFANLRKLCSKCRLKRGVLK